MNECKSIGQGKQGDRGLGKDDPSSNTVPVPREF